MYIEVVHDAEGNITHCYVADTLPVQDGSPLFTVEGGLPVGEEQARINIDTMTAMEIDGACGDKAVLDPVTGEPKIVSIERAQYITENYIVDTSAVITPPVEAKIPTGMKVKGLVKKTV